MNDSRPIAYLIKFAGIRKMPKKNSSRNDPMRLFSIQLLMNQIQINEVNFQNACAKKNILNNFGFIGTTPSKKEVTNS